MRQAGIAVPSGADQTAIGIALAVSASSRAHHDAAATLQRAGIAAGPVTPAHRLLDDPHLATIGFWRRAERRYVGTHIVPKPPFTLDGQAPPLRRPSPTLGEHNAEVLQGVLDLTSADIATLERDGIIGTKAT